MKYLFLISFVFFFLQNTGVDSALSERVSVYIPESIGSVDDSFQGSSGKLVIYIKDAHAFSEAQLNCARIIERLVQQNAVSLIGVEGAAGKLPIDDFRAFPIEEARNSVALDYLKKGFFSGAEYAAITSREPLYLFGVEDAELFQKNLAVFNKVIADKETIIASLIELHLVVADLKTYIFSNSLKTFEHYIDYYEDGKLGLTLFLSMLERHAKSTGIDFNLYPELKKVKKSLEEGEKIDSSRTEMQKNLIVNEIAATIRALPIEKDSKNLIENIVLKKQEEISESNYMRFLLDVAGALGISADSYSDLKKQALNSSNAGDVNFGALTQEIEHCIYEIRLRLAESDEEKKLVEYGQYISLLEKILSLEAVRSDVEKFVSDQKKSWDKCVSFLKETAEKYSISFDESELNQIDSALNMAYTFYDDAIMRDHAFISSLLNVMKSHDVAILVAGGFHEDGILRLLKRNDISYIAVKPFMSATQPDIPYVDKMQGRLFSADTSQTSNITVSLLYDRFFAGYPNLVSRFNSDAVASVVSLIMDGRASVESIIREIYERYDRTVPSPSYAAEFSQTLNPLIDRLAQLVQETPSERGAVAQYLQQRIALLVTDLNDKRTAEEISPPSENLKVSVVIPVYNELANGNIFDLLESFLQQDTDTSQFEIILVVNNSFDDSRTQSNGFLDNQRLIELVRYFSIPSGERAPVFINELSERQRQIIEDVRNKKLAVHVLDRSTNGLPGIVEQSAIRIGTIRNIGVYKAIDRFETIGQNGFIANLDADTSVPADYIARLIRYSQLDAVDAVYTNLQYTYASGDEFLFKSHFVEALAQLTWRFPEYLLSRAPQDMGTVRIIARANTFKMRGGFPDIAMSEDMYFSRLLNRTSSGIVSAYDISVTTKDRMRESRGFDSGIRHRYGQQMTVDEFVQFRGSESQPSIRAAFFAKDVRTRERQGITEEVLVHLLDFYGFTVTPQALETFRSTGSAASIVTAIEKANTFSLFAMEDNIADFTDKIVRKVSEQEYGVFRSMLQTEIEQENADIQLFQEQLRRVYDAVWEFPEKQTISPEQLRILIRQTTDYPLLRLLSEEEWFLSKLKTIGSQPYKEGYWNTFTYEFRDWLSVIDDSPRNVFRKALLYHRVFDRFIQQALHHQSDLPALHNYIVSATGNQYTSGEQSAELINETTGTAVPLPLISHELLESSL
ncbi:glycosyltransferase family 2 protein [bacterium]|nr:glycosyltransferase family 2 protein [bacterium]